MISLRGVCPEAWFGPFLIKNSQILQSIFSYLFLSEACPGVCVCVCARSLQVRDTVLPSRSPALVGPPFPTYFTEEEGDLDEDLYEDDLFVHTEPSLTLT